MVSKYLSGNWPTHKYADALLYRLWEHTWCMRCDWDISVVRAATSWDILQTMLLGTFLKTIEKQLSSYVFNCQLCENLKIL